MEEEKCWIAFKLSDIEYRQVVMAIPDDLMSKRIELFAFDKAKGVLCRGPLK